MKISEDLDLGVVGMSALSLDSHLKIRYFLLSVIFSLRNCLESTENYKFFICFR